MPGDNKYDNERGCIILFPTKYACVGTSKKYFAHYHCWYSDWLIKGWARVRAWGRIHGLLTLEHGTICEISLGVKFSPHKILNSLSMIRISHQRPFYNLHLLWKKGNRFLSLVPTTPHIDSPRLAYKKALEKCTFNITGNAYLLHRFCSLKIHPFSHNIFLYYAKCANKSLIVAKLRLFFLDTWFGILTDQVLLWFLEYYREKMNMSPHIHGVGSKLTSPLPIPMMEGGKI